MEIQQTKHERDRFSHHHELVEKETRIYDNVIPETLSSDGSTRLYRLGGIVEINERLAICTCILDWLVNAEQNFEYLLHAPKHREGEFVHGIFLQNQ